DNGAGRTEKMRITSAGNVGIGTVSPTATLHVATTSNSGGVQALLLQNNSGGTGVGQGAYMSFDTGNSGSGAELGRIGAFNSTNTTLSDSYMTFSTRLSDVVNERMRIDKNGNVGIGTTSPTYLLSVGSATPTGTIAQFENSTGSCYINPNNAFTGCTSDLRLKTSISALASSTLESVLALNPVTFAWKSDGANATIHTGFIAQEVQSIFPDLVMQGADGYLALNYAGFAPYLTGAIQELNAKVKQIEPIAGVLSVGPDVNAQCVVGDTKLRRRKKRADGSYEFDEVDIKDIAEGDEIQSLDERTGRVVYSRVNALIDMGEQEVYELVTRSGRRIRTTANHPFLARLASKKV
ncbi:MAG: tail fiber domain-containing protein, partial [Candidatus Pacebacteria bacterium]|nr:tail fiber domain-containing protein [Candidatus Paceibacterota bacterium]